MTFYDNWAGFSFKSGNFWRTDYFDVCSFNVHRKSQKTLDLGTAIQDAVSLLPPDAALFYSGGIDSEIIAIEMINQGRRPNLYFIDFNLNYHDREYAEKFCNDVGLQLLTVHIDIEHFLSRDIFEYAKYGCTDISTPLQMYARRLIASEVCMVSGVGDPPLYTGISQVVPHVKTEWMININENSEVARYMFCKQHFPNDVPLFYRYTPELVLAYLTDPIVLDFVRNERYKHSIKSSKHRILSQYFNFRQRPKYTGFENVPLDLRTNALTQLEETVGTRTLSYKYDTFVGLLT